MVTPYSISELSKDLCVLSSYIEEPRMCYTKLSDAVRKLQNTDDVRLVPRLCFPMRLTNQAGRKV